jgi:LysR family transcriptional regulator for metE and metH
VERIANRPKLDVRDLEVVIALATTGSTTKAASALHLTQSAVSRALGLAEDKAGTRLFDRTRQGLSPTPAGERLVAGARGILAQLAALEQETIAPSADAPMHVRLVCECYTAYRWLPSALVELRRALPRLEVSLALEHTDDPAPALARGEIDIALLTTAPLPSARSARHPLVEKPLFSDEVVFLVSASHPLASRRAITKQDLARHPMITSRVPPEEGRWFLRSVFGKATPSLSLLQLPLTEAIVDAVRAGMGIAVLSEWIASGYVERGDVVVKRLASGPLFRPWRIAYRRDVERAAEPLRGFLAGSLPRMRLLECGP